MPKRFVYLHPNRMIESALTNKHAKLGAINISTPLNLIQYGLLYGGGGIMAPPCNFSVSYGRRTKFANMGYLNVLSSKMALVFKFRPSMTPL